MGGVRAGSRTWDVSVDGWSAEGWLAELGRVLGTVCAALDRGDALVGVEEETEL